MSRFRALIILVIALTTYSKANPVIYRLNEQGLPVEASAEQEGKWASTGRGNYFRDSAGAVQGRTGQPSCGLNHQQYALPNVGQTGSGYYRYPSNYPIMNYPVIYYYAPNPTVAPIPSSQQPQTQRPKPTATVDQFQKQAVPFEQKAESTTSRPKPPGVFPNLPPVSYPIAGTWHSYVCSVLPQLPSCQPQTQPSPISYGYNPYPGYSQMAQYPVYYIVQPDVRPQSNVIPPGSIGYIKIIGPATIKPEHTETVDQETKTGVAPDVVKKPNGELDSEVVTAEGQEVKVQSTEGKKPVEEVSNSH